jgi:hypothetical protein
MSNSIQFGSNGEVISSDGTMLNSAIRPANALSDSAKANVNIQTRTSSLATYNTGAGPATQRVNATQVQLRAPTGLVKVGNFEVTPEAAATLAEAAPDLVTRVRGADGKDEYLTVDPAVKAQEAAKATDAARSEEISREDLNRHPDEIEGYHQHITGEVSQQNLIGLMVYGQKGEAPPESLLQNIAREMGEPLDSAIQKINLVNQGVQAQFTVLARSMNLDADKAADWLKDHRKDTVMVAAQAHYMRRDMMAWKPLLEDYRAATGDGVKR